MPLTRIPTSSITSGTLDTARLPTGTTIQTVKKIHTNILTTTTSTTNAYVATNLTATITPKKTGSSFSAHMYGLAGHVNPAHNGTGNRGFRCKWYYQVNSGSFATVTDKGTGGYMKNAGNDDSNSWMDIAYDVWGYHTPSYSLGDTLTYKMYFTAITQSAHLNHAQNNSALWTGGGDDRIDAHIELKEIAG